MHLTTTNFSVFFFLTIFPTTSFTSTPSTFEKDVTLTLDQKVILDKFRQKAVDKLPQDYMKSEIYLVKWLRTSNFQLDVAEERLFRHLSWRKERQLDAENDTPDLWEDDLRYSLDGRDKLGRPFLLVEMGNHDARRLIIQGKYDKLVRFYEHAFESACKLELVFSQRYKNMTRGILLVNLDGLNLQQNSCTLSPLSINVFVNIAKAAFSEEIRRSIYVHGKNKMLLREALSQDFDPDQLPPSLGGTKIYPGMEDENL